MLEVVRVEHLKNRGREIGVHTRTDFGRSDKVLFKRRFKHIIGLVRLCFH